ncbi:Eco57I restriction-modification methylase domain-containing protein [Proteocatella sphenisci]|uniref:Eco57I restriction-modification methylase domain-containing protein n=1 Tax=Proteocatella sphenisci TaxID=181070 RepID=UPI0004909C1C|nr:DNA methyltransferase [Proteocatella sphenisci]
MKPLSKELRNKFERTIENAREVAEEAAKIALEQLGVGEASPYSYLSEDKRALRRRLRAHGRNLGDIRDSKTETQEIDRLVEEIAYEHWHRMLFARFLAENDLLMYYEDDDIENAVPVTLSECDELAEELGLKNGWEMAAKLATKMLPQVFRADSPVFKIGLSPEKQRQLVNLVSNIEGVVFQASDSLGWAYQFWQNKKKELINKSESKIGDKELPIVTQLFTEPYMVKYLIDNTLGAWYVNKKLSEIRPDIKISHDIIIEEMAFSKDIDFSYLKMINTDKGVIPAAGEFKTWPDKLSELKIMDPSCGSGHFLVSIFLTLIPMRMEIEQLSAFEACNRILNENLFGLEIDKRCVEIAVFSIALAAWKYPNAGGYRKLPDIQIAWCGQSLRLKKEEWLDMVKDEPSLRFHMTELYETFKHSNILGSLINPNKEISNTSIFDMKWDEIHSILTRLANKQTYENDTLGVLAQSVEKAFLLLANQYQWVITNVPYLTMKKQDEKMKELISEQYPISKYDLSTTFFERMLELSEKNGVVSCVMPINWLFSKSYKAFREYILQTFEIGNIAILGSGAFDSISGEVVKVLLISVNKHKASKNHFYAGYDVSNYSDKSEGLLKEPMSLCNQYDQLQNPDGRILIEYSNSFDTLDSLAISKRGIVNGDNERWKRCFWELPKKLSSWEWLQSAVNQNVEFSGRQSIIDWSNKGIGMLRPTKDNPSYDKLGICVSRMGGLKTTIYTGEMYDQNTGVIVPNNNKDLLAIYCYCKSNYYANEVRKLDKKLNVTSDTLIQVPIDLEHWSEVAKTEYPNGLPKPYTDDPTQWIFHGHQRKSADSLQVAVARLMGYRWPAELDKEMELSDEAKALAEECEGLLSFADKDGIVCIPSVRGEAPASERLLNLLAAAYKDEDINMILSGLLSDADHAGKSLESWLRDKFFTQHYKLFGHRPFIWQIWDGLKDGFSALVNYHKLDRKNLETLIYTYLGDWISKQKSAMVEGIEGAEEKLNAATGLKKKLELILEGEAPYDIFVRWKPLNKQPLGWEPDLNDGVRINIRPFMSVGDVGKKGAGVLRDKPNIKWTKDRGKDTENSPWYHLFGGDRINDHYVTLEEKKKAREEMR